MKYISNTVLNTALDYIRNNATVIHICNDTPLSYSDLSSYTLGSATISISNFSITKLGITSGRRISVLDTAVTVSDSDSAVCVAIADVTETDLLYVTELNTVSVINGSEYNILEWDIEFRSPV